MNTFLAIYSINGQSRLGLGMASILCGVPNLQAKFEISKSNGLGVISVDSQMCKYEGFYTSLSVLGVFTF